jgi:hypothetical protein
MLLIKTNTVVKLAYTALRAMVVRARSDLPPTQFWVVLLFFGLPRYVSPQSIRNPLRNLAAVSIRARGKVELLQSSNVKYYWLNKLDSASAPVLP